jgi:hypothetical protein
MAHVQLAAAMTTTQKPRQEQFSAPYCSGDRGAFAGRIVGNHTLFPLELAPGDVTLVLILEQHIPFRLRAPKPRSTRLRPSLTLTLLIARPKA